MSVIMPTLSSTFLFWIDHLLLSVLEYRGAGGQVRRLLVRIWKGSEWEVGKDARSDQTRYDWMYSKWIKALGKRKKEWSWLEASSWCIFFIPSTIPGSWPGCPPSHPTPLMDRNLESKITGDKHAVGLLIGLLWAISLSKQAKKCFLVTN